MFSCGEFFKHFNMQGMGSDFPVTNGSDWIFPSASRCSLLWMCDEIIIILNITYYYLTPVCPIHRIKRMDFTQTRFYNNNQQLFVQLGPYCLIFIINLCYGYFQHTSKISQFSQWKYVINNEGRKIKYCKHCRIVFKCVSEISLRDPNTVCGTKFHFWKRRHQRWTVLQWEVMG